MIIVGITGTLGAGKGTIVDYLVEKRSFSHYSVRAYLTEEINRRRLPLNRDSMVLVANELRAMHGSAFIVEELFRQAEMSRNNCIIESIRTPGEADALRSKGNFFLLAVDAPAKLRYERIKIRMNETDHVSFEEFLANEKREMESDDPTKQNIGRCMQMADFVLINDKDLKYLYSQMEDVLLKLKI